MFDQKTIAPKFYPQKIQRTLGDWSLTVWLVNLPPPDTYPRPEIGGLMKTIGLVKL